MNTLNEHIITKVITDYLNSNLPAIRDHVLTGTKENMTEHEFYTQTLLNSIRVSTDLSVKIILGLLENLELIHLTSDEKELRKLLLHPVERDHEAQSET